MPDFKVGDRVRVRKDVKEPKYCWPATVPRNEIGVVRWFYQGCVYVVLPSLPIGTSPWGIHADDLELVEPAAPDPRDAEIAALKARVAELESRIASDDRLYYRQLVAHLSGGMTGNFTGTTEQFETAVVKEADAVFAAVKRREGGDDSASERPLQENCKKNFLVRGKNLLGG